MGAGTKLIDDECRDREIILGMLKGSDRIGEGFLCPVEIGKRSRRHTGDVFANVLDDRL